MTLPPGKQIGRYQIVKLIGSGGIASVYQAFDPLFDRNVAVKQMHTPFLVQEEFRKRFLREAQATARLRHPGIIETLDFGEMADQQLYIVMEYVQGPNLEELLAQWRDARRPIPWLEAARLMRQLAEAVAFANEHGVLHRDLKPANILLRPRQPTYSGEALAYDPLVTDFGLARLEGGADVTQPGVSIGGTPAYMAPEQLGNEPLDERCDVYSLGVIFYEVVTGQLPFQLKTLHDALRQHALNSLPLRMPKELRPDLPDALNNLISQAINPVHAHRLPTPRALAQALGTMVDSPPSSRVFPSPNVHNAPMHDATVPDLTVPNIRVPEKGVPNARVSDLDMSDATIPALSVPDRRVPTSTTPRPSQPAKSSGKTERLGGAGHDPNLTIGVDPALTLVSAQPVRRKMPAILLTTTILLIAAVLIVYFVINRQRATTVTDSATPLATNKAENNGAPTAAITSTTEVSENPTIASSAISPTLTDTLPSESSESSDTTEVIDLSQVITATVIGPDTSHPTQLWIDGDPIDWQVLRALSKSQTTALASIYEDEGNSGCAARFPGSTADVDLDAQVQFAYDAIYLYVSFLVQDDGVVTNAELSQYAQGDAPQLLLKLNVADDATSLTTREDEFQIDFLPGIAQVGDKAAAAIRTLATPTDVRAYSEGSVAASVLEDGYFLEAALPWSTFGPASPQAGQLLGMIANVSDNDRGIDTDIDTDTDPATTQQQECLLSTSANYNRESPEGWATLKLE